MRESPAATTITGDGDTRKDHAKSDERDPSLHLQSHQWTSRRSDAPRARPLVDDHRTAFGREEDTPSYLRQRRRRARRHRVQWWTAPPSHVVPELAGAPRSRGENR